MWQVPGHRVSHYHHSLGTSAGLQLQMLANPVVVHVLVTMFPVTLDLRREQFEVCTQE
jgi:hypothetical protein